MQYQLVLKFRLVPPVAQEHIQVLEAELPAALGESAVVDGFDLAPKAINLFILTPDPSSTFRRAKPVLERLQLLDKVVAAHRVVGGARFKVIWPLRWGRKFTVP